MMVIQDNINKPHDIKSNLSHRMLFDTIKGSACSTFALPLKPIML